MAADLKAPISIEDLRKVDIRVGRIRRIAEIAGSDKLVRMEVDFEGFTRTVVAGLKKERADPTEIKGKQALFVVNLTPRKMAGVISEAMLFDIGYEDGIVPVLAVPERPVPDGVRAG